MREMDNMKRIAKIVSEIRDIEDYLLKDEKDGYILRPYVRQRLEDRLQTLAEEKRDLNNNVFSDN